MSSNVFVYGAYGHTGRFVVAELLRRGLRPILAGRNATALAALGRLHPGLDQRWVSIDDPALLRAAIRGSAAVVNCAGPFLDTGRTVAAAAVRAGAHYVDVTAEQAAVQDLYRARDELASDSLVVLPAMGFYGGLPDLLATAAAEGWDAVDEVTVAIGLDRWWPTEGTRKTGRRNTATRLVVEDGRLVPAPTPAPEREWEFPGPLGLQTVIGNPFSEIITISRHLDAARVRTYLSARALADIHDPATPQPRAADESGRSAQRFAVEVAVRRGGRERRIAVVGRDIYAVTAPLVAEATERLLDGRTSAHGVMAPGAAFDAADFLAALSRHGTLSGPESAWSTTAHRRPAPAASP